MEEYCIYLRKSRVDAEAEARGAGDTLARHRAALLKLAGALRLPVACCYEEVRSGESIAARPEMRRLLSDVEEGRWAGVLVMEVERLARGNTGDQGLVADTFKFSGTKIITPAKIYDPEDEFDEEYFEFGLFMSRREYKAINRRLQRGRKASLSEGKYIAGRAPYGYERVKLPEKGYTLRPVPEKAQVVQRIFQWYAGGGPDTSPGAGAVAGRLNAQGVPSPSGGCWTACSIRDVLKNPAYIGLLRWSRRPTVKRMRDGDVTAARPVREVPLSPGLHEPIVTKALWEQAQALLKGRTHAPVPGNRKARNPLAGLVLCGFCGRPMERRKYSGGREALVCPTESCGCVSSALEEVESDILEGLRLWLGDFRVSLPEGTSYSPGAEAEAVRLRRLIAGLEKQFDLLCGFLEQEIYTPEVYTRRGGLLTQRLASAREALAHTEGMINLEQAPHSVQPEGVDVPELYWSLADPGDKNALLKELLCSVIYQKSQGGRWAESDLRLFLFPRLDLGRPITGNPEGHMYSPTHRS